MDPLGNRGSTIANVSQASDVNKDQGPITFNELVVPTHTVCADVNQGNETVFGSSAE